MKVNYIKGSDDLYVEIGRVIVGQLTTRYDKQYYFKCLSNYPLSVTQLKEIVTKMGELNGT
jgi:hypothetical protein